MTLPNRVFTSVTPADGPTNRRAWWRPAGTMALSIPVAAGVTLLGGLFGPVPAVAAAGDAAPPRGAARPTTRWRRRWRRAAGRAGPR
jgi:hypothetical protein